VNAPSENQAFELDSQDERISVRKDRAKFKAKEISAQR
jgi:hypothetical protein